MENNIKGISLLRNENSLLDYSIKGISLLRNENSLLDYSIKGISLLRNENSPLIIAEAGGLGEITCLLQICNRR